MTTPDVCPHCGSSGVVQSSIDPPEPIQITTKVMLNDRELVRAVNKWNADRPARDAIRRSAAAALYRYRWSWWRFTFTVRR